MIVSQIKTCDEGFQAFDCFTNKVERVIAPVGIVAADLPAKADVTPCVGHTGNVFCSRDLFSRRTEEGLEIKQDIDVLNQQ